MQKFRQGQHVWASFNGNPPVKAIVLEVKGDKLVVQQWQTERAEEIPAAHCRPF